MKQILDKTTFLTDDEIIDIIMKYINKKETNSAILIDGEWGSGKTYFIKEKLIPILKKLFEDSKKNKSSIKCKKPMYISLYGVNDISEISKAIYINLISEKRKKIITAPINIVQFIKPDINYSKIIEMFEEFVNLEKSIIIFDDLERCNIDINMCLGYINNLVEHNKVKVIIVANEKEIGKINYDKNYELKLLATMNKEVDYNDPEIKNLYENKKRTENDIKTIEKRVQRIFNNSVLYKSIKEKLIGRTIFYKPRLLDIYDNLISSVEISDEINELLKYKKDYIIERLEYNQCCNIRTFKFIIEAINEIFTIVNSLKIKNRKVLQEDLIRYIIDACIFFKTTGKVYEWNNNLDIDTITLKGDERVSYLDYSIGFKFVDIYIKLGILNKPYIEKTIKEYSDYHNYQIRDEDDPYYKLTVYWELEDDEIINYLNLIEIKLKKGEYSSQIFPKMIRTFSGIEHMKFQVEKINELIKIMKEQILNEDEDCVDLDPIIDRKEEFELYNKNIRILEEALYDKKAKKKENEFNEIINDSNWGVKLNDYCYSKKDEFLGDRIFLANFNIEKIINNIRNSDTKNIYCFKYCIDRVYRFSNIREFYENDIPSFQKLIIELKNIIEEKNEYGYTKKEALVELLKSLEEKLQLLNRG